MVEYLRPDADSSDGAWTDHLGGTNLYAALNETAADDANYVKSAPGPTADVFRVSLGNPGSTVDTSADVIVRYRIGKVQTGAINLTVRLKQGTTVIATWTHSDIASAFTTVSQILTAGQKSAITDWTDLLIEFQADSAVWDITAGEASATLNSFPAVPTSPAWSVTEGDSSATLTSYPGMT